MDTAPLIRRATPADGRPLHALINRAYRGAESRSGWTHEADYLEGERISAEAVASILADARETMLVASDGERLIGCVQLGDRGGGFAHLGLLTVDPGLQAAGLGKRLLAAAEGKAAGLGATCVELTVVHRRTELIAYYERRGYALTGERRAFPYPLPPTLFLELVVLTKPLPGADASPRTSAQTSPKTAH